MGSATRDRFVYVICGACQQSPEAPRPSRSSCQACAGTGMVRTQFYPRDVWEGAEPEYAPIRDLHDITRPPVEGAQPVRCTAGCDDGVVDIPRAVVGPIMGTPLAPGELTTILRPGRCRACKGRGWVWGHDGPAGTNS